MQQRVDLERGKHGEEATGHGEEGLLSWVPRAAQAAGSPVLYQILCVVSASYVVALCCLCLLCCDFLPYLPSTTQRDFLDEV